MMDKAATAMFQSPERPFVTPGRSTCSYPGRRPAQLGGGDQGGTVTIGEAVYPMFPPPLHVETGLAVAFVDAIDVQVLFHVPN
jgi:hypothetical protein